MTVDDVSKAEMLEFWRGRVREQPADPECWLGLGLAYADDNRIDMAIDAFRRSIHIDPRRAQTHEYFANLLADVGRHEEARVAFEAATQLAPTDWTLHYNHGISLMALNDLHTAEEAFRRAAQCARPDAPFAHGRLGLVLCRLGRFREALDAFVEASDRDITYFDTRHEEAVAWQLALDGVAAEHARLVEEKTPRK